MNSPLKAENGVLIVEDEAITGALLEGFLEDLGLRVAGFAETGEDAVRLAADLQPSLVLMDIRLAGELTGVEAARRIRTRSEVPIVFLTANPEQLPRDAAAQNLCWLTKPVDEKELVSVIQKALS